MSNSKIAVLRAATALAVPAIAVLGLAGTGHASTYVPAEVEVVSGALVYRGTAADNRVHLQRNDAGRVVVTDEAGIAVVGYGCRQTNATTAECSVITGMVIHLRAGNDVFTSTWAANGVVYGGDGADSFYAGVADGVSRVRYFGGGGGNDVVSYSKATRGVAASIGELGAEDTTPLDGRDGNTEVEADQDRISSDVEAIIGSPFNDSMWGNSGANTLYGGAGRDRFFAGAGNDTINAKDGANDLWIDCGQNPAAPVPNPDRDYLVMDASDVVRPGCETKVVG